MHTLIRLGIVVGSFVLLLAQSGCLWNSSNQCDTAHLRFLGGQNGVEVSGYFDSDGTLLNVGSAINKRNVNVPFYVNDMRGYEYDGFKKIQLSITNCKQSKLDLEYRVTWIDCLGMEIDPNLTHWEPIEIEGRMVKAITVTAHSAQAESFRINIRPITYSKVIK